jgi:putative addiction module killer protein
VVSPNTQVEVRERKILSYQTSSGSFPYRVWRNGFTDEDTEVAIDVRVTRLSTGNFSDSKSIGEGAFESRIDFGPGYRVYYGADGDDIVLLCGGDKSTQDQDIKRAKEYWKDYKDRIKVWRSQQSSTRKNSSEN